MDFREDTARLFGMGKAEDEITEEQRKNRRLLEAINACAERKTLEAEVEACRKAKHEAERAGDDSAFMRNHTGQRRAEEALRDTCERLNRAKTALGI